jgi:hypothetical protein
VIGGLKETGTDPAADHTLDHTFIGPPAALAAIERELAAEGFGEPCTSSRALTMSIVVPLDQDLIDGLTMWLRRVAAAHGATYDGWGAAVVRASNPPS